MSEYIVRMPSNMPYEIKAELNAWYVNSEPIVRCKDCIYISDDGLTIAWCNENCREVRPRDYCAWGYKK